MKQSQEAFNKLAIELLIIIAAVGIAGAINSAMLSQYVR